MIETRIASVLAVACLVAGCTSETSTNVPSSRSDTSAARDTSSSDENSEPDGDRCTPGRSVACTCSGGERGVQVCQTNGTFGACRCADDTGLNAGRDSGERDSAQGDTDAVEGDASPGDDDGGGDACTCTEAGLPCCDGCHLLEQGTRCSSTEGTGGTCKKDGCGGVAQVERKFRVCNGTSPACPDNKKKRTVETKQCGPNEVCRGSTCEQAFDICG